MFENLILPVVAFAATILGLESAWRWLGNQERYNKGKYRSDSLKSALFFHYCYLLFHAIHT